MKNLSISALMLMGGLCFFTACEDDRDSNPTIQQPTTFVLNEPAYANSTIDLANSKEIRLTYSQPDYGYTAKVDYQVQLSLDGNFTVSVDEADADESGSAVADYVMLENVYNDCVISVDAASVAKGLQQIAKWPEESVPANQKVAVRMYANVSGYTITSNVVNINVAPYYVELKDALPEMWYILGSGASGAWDNAWDKIGTAMIPMSVVKDFEYDKKTGKGELTYTGYFNADGFKIVKTPGSWDDQWGQDDAGKLILKDGGDIKPTPGYYTLTMNTADNTLTMEAVDLDPTTYTTIGLIGGFNDWATDLVMKQFAAAVNPHLWSVTFETAVDTEVKFRADADWAVNWGAAEFPYGNGTLNGANIAVPAGKYIVVFNDIDGSYTFTTVE